MNFVGEVDRIRYTQCPTYSRRAAITNIYQGALSSEGIKPVVVLCVASDGDQEGIGIVFRHNLDDGVRVDLIRAGIGLQVDGANQVQRKQHIQVLGLRHVRRRLQLVEVKGSVADHHKPLIPAERCECVLLQMHPTRLASIGEVPGDPQRGRSAWGRRSSTVVLQV